MSTPDSTTGTVDLAKDHAQQASETAQARTGEVADHAKDATKDVVATASDQVGQVKEETVRQARSLAHEASDQVSQLAGDQTQRLTGLLRELGDELKQMASAGNGGTATEAAHQASQRAQQAAGYLEGRDPAALLDDLRSYARRRPGAFLAGAAILGLAAGRLGRGIKDAPSTGTGATASAHTYSAAPTVPPPALDLRDANMGLSSDMANAYSSHLLDVPAGDPLLAEAPGGGMHS